MDFAAKFDEGLSYDQFLESHGSEDHRRNWQQVHDEVSLADAQRELLAGFRREMLVLVMTGAWCGDCVRQCPICDRFAAANSKIQIRYFDRDAHEDLKDALSICGGTRVPVVVFLSEDGQEVARYGDRTLSKYRDMAVTQLGPACPTGIARPEQPLLAAVTQDWLNEFERAQLILRTSPRLRKKHGD